ncbi:hypothetical protein [Carnimonas bestiolae]|uniref:hypothetical protein n=1 Tax=Carnimonas bestiolae TaxID=3402172 RepID=UPI003EDC8B59
MSVDRIDFYSEVMVRDCAKSPELRNKKAIVMGISEEDGIVYGYGISVEGMFNIYRVGRDEIEPTGKKYKREDFYNGSSIGVTPDGELTRVNIKKD